MRLPKIVIVMAILLTFVSFTQGQNSGIHYQAVVRDASGAILPNQQVSFQFSIVTDSLNGSVLYTESHAGITTNEFGMVNLLIGSGTPTVGTFNAIDWSSPPHFVNIGLDTAGGLSFTAMGGFGFYTVPYAYFAAVADSTKNDGDRSANNEVQTLVFSNDTLSLTLDNGSILLTHFLDTTDLGNIQQTIIDSSIATRVLIDSVEISLTNLINGDKRFLIDRIDSTNQFLDSVLAKQTADSLKFETSITALADSIDVTDRDSTNELQTLQLFGDSLDLTKGGSVDLSKYNQTDSINSLRNRVNTLQSTIQPTVTQVGTNTNDILTLQQQIAAKSGDSSSTNELQTLSRVGDTLVLSNTNDTIPLSDFTIRIDTTNDRIASLQIDLKDSTALLRTEQLTANSQLLTALQDSTTNIKLQTSNNLADTASTLRGLINNVAATSGSGLSDTAQALRTTINTLDSALRRDLVDSLSTLDLQLSSNLADSAAQLRTEQQAANSQLLSKINSDSTNFDTLLTQLQATQLQNLADSTTNTRAQLADSTSNIKLQTSNNLADTASALRRDLVDSLNAVDNQIINLQTKISSDSTNFDTLITQLEGRRTADSTNFDTLINNLAAQTGAGLADTAAAIRADLVDSLSTLDFQLSTNLTDTTFQLRSEQQAANSQLLSKINSDSTNFDTRLTQLQATQLQNLTDSTTNIKLQTSNNLADTAAAIRAAQQTASSQQLSALSDTASAIRSSLSTLNSQLSTEIGDTASDIRTALTDSTAALRSAISSAGDNLGNHTATQNIQLDGNYLSNDGGNEGISINNDGDVGINLNGAQRAELDIEGTQIIRSSDITGVPIINEPYLFLGYDTTREIGIVSSLNTPTTAPLKLYGKEINLEVGTSSTSWFTNSIIGLKIDSAGQVGVGTDGPTAKLNVVDGTQVTSGGYSTALIEAIGTSTTGTYQRGLDVQIAGSDGENEAIFGASFGNSADLNTGVFGRALNGQTNYGVRGNAGATPTGSNFAIGVLGTATDSSGGINYGLYGHTQGSNNINRGVVGVISGANSPNDAAIYGIANSEGKNNVALYGRSAFSNSGGINYGLYSRATGADTNYAAYFAEGDVYIKDFVGLNTKRRVSDEALTIKTADQKFGWIHTNGDVSLGSWLYSDISPTNKGGAQIGTFSNHRLDFITNNSQPKMSIDTLGRVGIGTTSPISKLAVVDATTAPFIGIEGVSSGFDYAGIIMVAATPKREAWLTSHRSATSEEHEYLLQYFNGNTYQQKLQLDTLGYLTLNNAFTFPNSDGTTGQVLQTDGSGNLTFQNQPSSPWLNSNNYTYTLSDSIGIGTSSPQAPLDIETGNADIFLSTIGSVGEYSGIFAKRASGSPGLEGAVADGERLLKLSASGHDGTSYIEGARIDFEVDGAVSTGILPGRLVFRTRHSGGGMNERMTIKSDGKIGINESTPGYQLDVNGNFSANSININDAFTLPTTDGTNGQVLQTDGSGTLSWSSISGSSGLEQITENGNTGFRLTGSDPNNYGDIGENSTDFSTQDQASTTRGATAPNAFAAGHRTTASGWHSTAFGQGSTASGNNSVAAIGGTSSGAQSLSLGYQTNSSGQFSRSIGVSAIASGERSTAIGSNVTASANRSTAIGGDGTIASGDHSLAMGQGNIASGNNSVAIGYATTASGNKSTSMGENTQATGANSTSMGKGTTASGSYSTAMGFNSMSTAFGSTSTGVSSNAEGDYSTAMGRLTRAYGVNSTAIGKEVKAYSLSEVVIGSYNTYYSPNGGISNYDAADRLFVIGNGTTPSFPSDALIMLKNGNTTINGQLTLSDGTSSITFPNSDGTNGQVLQTDGSGNVTWQNAATDTDDQTLSLTNSNRTLNIADGNSIDVRVLADTSIQANIDSSAALRTALTDSTTALRAVISSAGDNLGNHTATQNLQLNGKFLSNDGGNEGISINNDGDVGIGTTTPTCKLDVNGVATIRDQFDIYKAGGTRISHFNWGANGDIYLRSSETAGKIILQDGGGSVMIGTTTPTGLFTVSDNSNNYTGVFSNNASTSITEAVQATATGTSGSNTGVRAKANGATISNYGLNATADGSGATNYAVYADAQNGTANYALYANAGDVVVNDSLRIQTNTSIAGSILKNSGTGASYWAVDTLTCPAGFTKVNDDFCIETVERTATTWFSADSVCTLNGYKLPDYSDWYGATSTKTLTGEENDWEWVSNISQNNMMVVGNGGRRNRTFYDPETQTATYRCIYRKQ